VILLLITPVVLLGRWLQTVANRSIIDLAYLYLVIFYRQHYGVHPAGWRYELSCFLDGIKAAIMPILLRPFCAPQRRLPAPKPAGKSVAVRHRWPEYIWQQGSQVGNRRIYCFSTTAGICLFHTGQYMDVQCLLNESSVQKLPFDAECSFEAMRFLLTS
jgi:hypothetical protein